MHEAFEIGNTDLRRAGPLRESRRRRNGDQEEEDE
jgi:hypothetical protein